ncbi:hypothetical protein DV737_g4794, partial [Chaetothyriales sp. CBS 132003]
MDGGEWVQNPKEPPLDVALKEIIPDVQLSDGAPRPQTDWKDILFELRALLHEPIRYHPNLVRLLGIQWGLSPISDSTYPVLIMEYASLGTFKTLQTSSEPLSFPVKQKLCYDVGRALSALHASGIVHGDMKHENVLIFPSKKPVDGIPYTAKLADFGGTVMDMAAGEVRKMETWTWPFQAPEVTDDQALTRSGMMLTDVYSFGLLVWRAFLDGEGFVSLPGAAQTASDEEKRGLTSRKASEDLTNTAIVDICEYAKERGLSQECVDMMTYTVLHTVQLRPEDRDLVKAQAALRGIRPGFRPRLDQPNPEEFMFEPEGLKSILTWDQQRQMLDEMKEVASSTNQVSSGLLEMKKTVAAFYVFQCYLLEFGAKFNVEEAIAWLLKASSDDNSHEDQDYLSQAWLWRISRALDIPIHGSIDRAQSLLNNDKTAFDLIYVNRRGHGLLHYAAAAGATNALRHMITKYKCDVNIPSQHVDESPLVCACEGGNVDCVLLLLNNGADPNGYRFGQEGPLHWLCSFLPAEMETIASKLVSAGADIELRSGGMRHDVRGIRADWEHIFEIRTTPLGRAVLMNNLDAVKVLLKLGANPLAKNASKHRGEWEGMGDFSKMIDVSSPFELAAVLTLPSILGEFIKHIDSPSGTPRLKLLDEWSMLDLAHAKKVTKFDPVSLQSRLVRCGMHYKRDMKNTLLLLHARDQPVRGGGSDELQKERSRVLCKEVALGNLDIVQVLLEIGYSANGTQDFRPLEKAVETNNEEMFKILVRYKVDMTVTRMTPTGGISMLHLCALRSQHSRPGRAIADALIAAGVPIESTDARSRPPLAMAIMNQNFDVAQALLENGANVDAIYPLSSSTVNGTETKAVSVLLEVLSQHTMRTLESLKFLFGKREGGPGQRPAFYIDHANKISILHLLAGSPQFTQIAQITPKILNLCLETYAEPELINFRHPILGTALYYAATCGNKTMVELLLQHGADETYNSGPDVDGSVHTLLRSRESWSPLWAAILRLEDELNKGTHFPPEGAPGAWLKSNMIQNLQKTLGLLSERSHDALARQAIDQLQKRKECLEAESYARQKDRMGKRREIKAREEEAPIDLGILSGDRGKQTETKIREICQGPEQEWKTGGLEWFLKSLALSH